jgi:hypothetical protein
VNLVNPVYFFLATHNPETPNGMFAYLRSRLSAPSMRASTPFNADTFYIVLALGFDARQPHQLSHRQYRHEKRDVRVTRALNFEARLLQHSPQLRHPISPTMMA